MLEEKSGIDLASEYIADCITKQWKNRSKTIEKFSDNPTETTSLGEEILSITARDERAREKEQQKGREEAVRMEEEQKIRASKDKNRLVTR